MEIITQEEEQVNQLSSQTDLFFSRLKIGRQLSGLRFRKIHGESPVVLLKFLIQIVWTGKNWYRLGRDGESAYKKDVIYRFLNNQEYDWEGLLSQHLHLIGTYNFKADKETGQSGDRRRYIL